MTNVDHGSLKEINESFQASEINCEAFERQKSKAMNKTGDLLNLVLSIKYFAKG